MDNPGASFEWYLRTFYNLNINEISDHQIDSYRSEFEIWQDASGKDKAKMWPVGTRTYSDTEDYDEMKHL